MLLVMVIIAFGVRYAFLNSSESRKPDPRKPDPDREVPDSNDDPLQPESDFVVSSEGDEVKCTRPDGKVESFCWSKLEKVEILTTSEGPLAADVFWVFHDSEGGRASIPCGATGEPALMDKALALPGFDLEKFTVAQASTGDATFPVWTRPEKNEA